MPEHPFTILLHKGENIKIDNDLVEVIQACWKVGIDTSNCCQKSPRWKNDEGMCWIQFDSDNFVKFINIIKRVDYTDNKEQIDEDHLFNEKMINADKFKKCEEFYIKFQLFNTANLLRKEKDIGYIVRCNFYFHPKHLKTINRKLQLDF